MRVSKRTIDRNLNELLAEARALHFAMKHNALPYTEAKKRVKPMLERLNKTGAYIAQKHGMKYRKVTFQNLGENL